MSFFLVFYQTMLSQNPVDSSGTSLTICGENFGPYYTDDISIDILDVSCEDVEWKQDTFVCGSNPYLRCQMPSSYVGKKNVSITVGGQTNHFNDAIDPVLRTQVTITILHFMKSNCDDIYD